MSCHEDLMAGYHLLIYQRIHVVADERKPTSIHANSGWICYGSDAHFTAG
jgi:hypothetical protein